MSRQSIPRIITNRQLNFTLSPVDTYNPKKMPYSLHNYEIDGTWNHHQSIILDCVLERIFNGFYKQFKKPPQSWRSKKTLQVINGFSREIINPDTISFLSLSPFEAYKECMGYDIFKVLREQYDYYLKVNQDQMEVMTFKQFVETEFANNPEYQHYYAKMSSNVENLYQDNKLTVLTLLEAYPSLKRYRYKLPDYLKKISQTKFKMNYKVKYMARKPTFDDSGKLLDRGELIDLNYQMRNFQQLFNTEVKDGKIILNFKTPLGKLVIHNMLIMDTDWLPLDALKLSKNAYFLYKRFVLNKRSGKFKASKIELEFEDLKTFLDIKWSNNRGVYAIIAKALNDMKQKGLILIEEEGQVSFEYTKKMPRPAFAYHMEKKTEKGIRLITLVAPFEAEIPVIKMKLKRTSVPGSNQISLQLIENGKKKNIGYSL